MRILGILFRALFPRSARKSNNFQQRQIIFPRFVPEHHPSSNVTAGRNKTAYGTTQVGNLRGHCYVVDGDTIVINNTNIRLAGIDAPEMDQPYGNTAKWALHKLCKGHVITAEFADHFSYERHVATCYLPDGRDLSSEMVAQGLALDWHRFSGGKYRHLEPEGVRRKLWRVEAKHQGRMPPSKLN